MAKKTKPTAKSAKKETTKTVAPKEEAPAPLTREEKLTTNVVRREINVVPPYNPVSPLGDRESRKISPGE